MTLEVQICTYGLDGLQRAAQMTLPAVDGVRYRICMQNPDGAVIELPEALRRPDVDFFQHPTRGLSLNRNAALDRAEADIILIADDDLHYSDAGLRAVIDTFAADPRGADIRLHIGDALDIVPRLEGSWDMVFIDANKRNYTDYLDMVLPRVYPGGWILADNTLWDGHILSEETCRDAQSRAIAAFNDRVAADPALEKVILPVRDGLTIIRKKA